MSADASIAVEAESVMALIAISASLALSLVNALAAVMAAEAVAVCSFFTARRSDVASLSSPIGVEVDEALCGILELAQEIGEYLAQFFLFDNADLSITL